jgi:hypothetical protein
VQLSYTYIVVSSNIMKYEKQLDIVNELVELAEIIQEPIRNSNEPYKSFGILNYNITFSGYDKLGKYQTGLENLFNFKKEISETLTLKKFENELVGLIRISKNREEKCSIKEIETFFENFLTIKVSEVEILYELYGAQMKVPKMEFGDFTVYDFDLSINELTIRYPYLGTRDIFFSHRQSRYLLGVKVKARENAKAIELANKLCETFENVFSYMIADLKHQRTVGIFNFRGWKTTNIVVCNNESMGYHGQNSIFIPVEIDDDFFMDPSQGNNKIWNLITKANKTEIEKRLINSIEWIGKAIHDNDISKSLVQFVFAIEGMLQLNEKALITPSIVSQLSDWLVFITNDDLEQRKKISKYFKEIYQKRSAIAHGAAKTIDVEDLGIALQISKLMIITILTVSPFSNLKTIDELNKCIIDLKFK